MFAALHGRSSTGWCWALISTSKKRSGCPENPGVQRGKLQNRIAGNDLFSALTLYGSWSCLRCIKFFFPLGFQQMLLAQVWLSWMALLTKQTVFSESIQLPAFEFWKASNNSFSIRFHSPRTTGGWKAHCLCSDGWYPAISGYSSVFWGIVRSYD